MKKKLFLGQVIKTSGKGDFELSLQTNVCRTPPFPIQAAFFKSSLVINP